MMPLGKKRVVGGISGGGPEPDTYASPETVGLFLAASSKVHKVSTLRLALSAISERHRISGYPIDSAAPAIRDVMRGIARTMGTAPSKKEAATVDVVRDTVRALSKASTIKSLRDRAMILIGFSAALRRSELAAIDVEHVRFTADGIVLTLPRRKTDQEGAGTEIGIPFGKSEIYCPVMTLKAYLEAAGITTGAVFRTATKHGTLRGGNRIADKDVARTVKTAVAAAGFDSDIFSGHSLRSGFATSAGRAGVPERVIMLQTGHKSLPVLRGYIRRGSLFSENAAALVGL